MTRAFPQLDHPIIQAPLAGGPSTPELAAAVSAAGGLGFLAAGYKRPQDLAGDIARTRELTSEPVGVNLFVLGETGVDHARLAAYAKAIERDARRHDVGLGEPHFDDDAFLAKLEVVCRLRPPIVSFTFGCPAPEVVRRLHELDIAAWVTVTEVDEALLAVRAGADALIVQGVEAGGHRGGFEDADGRGDVALLPLLRLVARACDLPLIATGGIADGAAVATVLGPVISEPTLFALAGTIAWGTAAAVGPIKAMVRSLDRKALQLAMADLLAAPPASMREALSDWATTHSVELA